MVRRGAGQLEGVRADDGRPGPLRPSSTPTTTRSGRTSGTGRRRSRRASTAGRTSSARASTTGSRPGPRSRADPSPLTRDRDRPGTIAWSSRPPCSVRDRRAPSAAVPAVPAVPPSRRGGSRRPAPPTAAPPRGCSWPVPLGWLGHRLSRVAARPVPQRVLDARRLHRPGHPRVHARQLRRRSSRPRSTASVTLRTVAMAAAVTVTCAVLAFPIAYYMARVASPRRVGCWSSRSSCRSGRATSSRSTRGG